jgi:hypothetical protein
MALTAKISFFRASARRQCIEVRAKWGRRIFAEGDQKQPYFPWRLRQKYHFFEHQLGDSALRFGQSGVGEFLPKAIKNNHISHDAYGKNIIFSSISRVAVHRGLGKNGLSEFLPKAIKNNHISHDAYGKNIIFLSIS